MFQRALIRSQDEFKLRYMQWVENINRQDLSLWEKFNNLSSIAEAYKKVHQVEVDVSKLKELLGVSDAQSYRYYSLLKADEEIIELIKSGTLTKSSKLFKKLFFKTKSGQRTRILEKNHKSKKKKVTSFSKFKKISKDSRSKSSSISLGKINNVDIARYILDVLLTDSKLKKHQDKFRNIDWNSAKDIARAFKSIFAVVEKELQIEETA